MKHKPLYTIKAWSVDNFPTNSDSRSLRLLAKAIQRTKFNPKDKYRLRTNGGNQFYSVEEGLPKEWR